MSGRGLVLFLQAITLCGSALTALKLWNAGLYRRYPVFFSYFVLRVPDGLWALFLPLGSDTYFYLWIVSEPLFWLFQVLVMRELIGLVLQRHKGLSTLGRWAMYSGILVSVSLSLISFLLKFKPGRAQGSHVIAYFMATDRGINLCLALFLILMVFLVSRYPIALSRNIIVHTVLFTVFFLANSLTALLRSVLGIRLFTSIDVGLMAMAAACTFGWFFFLTPEGETAPSPPSELSPDREREMLYHLDALSAALLKVSRK
jgi:hypothetical protein